MPAISRSRSILFTWAGYGAAAGALFALAYSRMIFVNAHLWDLLLTASWYGLPAGLACGLLGGAIHVLAHGRCGAWLGGVAAASVTPGFLTWVLDGCPRVKWEVGLGPSAPWIVLPFVIIVALGGWMSVWDRRAARTAPPWRSRLYHSVPAFLVAMIIVVYQVELFGFTYPRFWLGD